MCDVKRCRKERTITVLNAQLCDDHYEKHCEGVELDTHKGFLTFCSGATVLQEG